MCCSSAGKSRMRYARNELRANHLLSMLDLLGLISAWPLQYTLGTHLAPDTHCDTLHHLLPLVMLRLQHLVRPVQLLRVRSDLVQALPQVLVLQCKFLRCLAVDADGLLRRRIRGVRRRRAAGIFLAADEVERLGGRRISNGFCCQSSEASVQNPPFSLPRLESRSFCLPVARLSELGVVELDMRLNGPGPSACMPSGAEAKATGLEISSSMFSSMPQNRENGSSVSGMAPRLRKDSSDEEDECMGEREYGSPLPRDVVGEVLAGEVTARGRGGGRLAGRMAKGGGPSRVAASKLFALQNLK